jgi:hypothetical protein
MKSLYITGRDDIGLSGTSILFPRFCICFAPFKLRITGFAGCQRDI